MADNRKLEKHTEWQPQLKIQVCKNKDDSRITKE
jgi:hypothetical protein